MQALVIAAIIFALCVAIFASQNALPVEIKLILWTVETPLVVIVIVASALGALIMGLPGWIKQFAVSIKMRKLKSQYKELKIENDRLLVELDGYKIESGHTYDDEGVDRDSLPLAEDANIEQETDSEENKSFPTE